MNNDKVKEVQNDNQVKKKNTQSLALLTCEKHQREQVMQKTMLNLQN